MLPGGTRPVRLEGFGPEMGRWFAERWLAVPADGVQGAADDDYVIRRRTDDCPRLLAPAGEPFAVSRHDGRVRIRGRGGWLEVEPGRPGAEVAIPQDASGDGSDQRDLVAHALHHALALDGSVLLHAVAVEIDGVGILAAAPSGGGKSTFAAACVRCGGRVVSDDLVAVSCMSGRPPLAWGVRRDLHLRPAAREVVGEPAVLRLADAAFGSGRRLVARRSDGTTSFVSVTVLDVTAALVVDPEVDDVQVRRTTAAQSLAVLIDAGTPLLLGPMFPTERERLTSALRATLQATETIELRVGHALMREPARVVPGLVRELRGGGPARSPEPRMLREVADA